MSASLLAVLLFAAWTISLVLMIGLLRVGLVVVHKRRSNDFRPSGEDVSPFSGRLCRAHANCVENLGIFSAVILVAIFLDYEHITDPLALWFLAARVAQSVTHLISTRQRAVLLRFVFYVIQVLIVIIFIARILLEQFA